MKIQNIELKTAQDFITKHHRHCPAPRGWRFGAGLFNNAGELIGVVTAGNPVARYLNDGRTLEVNRSCTLGDNNANSKLYAAVIGAAKYLGYRKIITYSLLDESGSSLKAVGFKLETANCGGGNWVNRTGRKRNDKTNSKKNRWSIKF